MISKTRILALGAACWAGLTLLPSVQADDLDQNLVAKWTFKDGSLTSSEGGFTFFEMGNRGQVDTGDSTVTLREKKYLVSEDISSAKFPGLKDSVTIWARFKIDQFPDQGEGCLLSLQAEPKGGSWSSFVFSLLYMGRSEQAPNPGLSFIARLEGGKETGVGVSRFQPVQAGEFVNVAIVFNGPGRTASLWVNGNLVFNKLEANQQLRDFAALAIGSVSTEGRPFTTTFEEVRVYSSAFDAEWLSEITASKE